MKKFEEILSVLSHNDPALAKVINLIKPVYIKKTDDEFTSLIKTIIGQQLSGTAAKTIINRVKNTLEEKVFTPKKILNINHEDLRSCGMSNAKIHYVKGFAEILIANPCYFFNLKKNTEENVLIELCKIKGVGIWTASIFAMSSLNYENIFAYGDVSLNKAIKIIYKENLSQEDIISNWSPYKSFACRVLWQWIDKGMPNLS